MLNFRTTSTHTLHRADCDPLSSLHSKYFYLEHTYHTGTARVHHERHANEKLKLTDSKNSKLNNY